MHYVESLLKSASSLRTANYMPFNSQYIYLIPMFFLLTEFENNEDNYSINAELYTCINCKTNAFLLLFTVCLYY